MATTVKWSMNISAVGGPQLTSSGTLEADAYEVINVKVEPDSTDLQIRLNSTSSELALLAITADRYEEKITYTTQPSASASTSYILDGPHLMFGKASLVQFNSSPLSLYFNNKTDKPVTLTIFVGRDATP